ncbi:PadR family transcriptional regulator [Actinopolymorpha alba]|uniref:PadR family transcriptional regulator n=1 Tax=Actinopolymorpha alba TaxID=533267 RepID=UPI0003694CDF|nr:PadR family transcriptional regulator [Actinopolymorpha alba]
MSIRHGLLALLDEGPKYGYQLRQEFERATGATWPLNVGQVYTTLTRLERDGLVRGEGSDESGRVGYALTDEGRTELHRWFATPISRETRPRDELAIKLALATTVPGVDVTAIVQGQRTSTLRTLRELTRLKKAAAEDDLPWLLVLDSMIFQAEAEVRWLDHCESRLARSSRSTAPARPSAENRPADDHTATDHEGVRR